MSDPRNFINEQISTAQHEGQENMADRTKQLNDVKDKVADNLEELVENGKGDLDKLSAKAGDKTFSQQVTDAIFSK